MNNTHSIPWFIHIPDTIEGQKIVVWINLNLIEQIIDNGKTLRIVYSNQRTLSLKNGSRTTMIEALTFFCRANASNF